MKILRKIIVALVALAFIISSLIYLKLKSVVPSENGKEVCSEIRDSVSVFYDAYAVPHIYAKDEQDAFFALGFVQARERLFQMELLRRVGSGRLSEIFGHDLVQTDMFFRTLGIARLAEQYGSSFDTSNGDWQRKARAYLEGINHFIETGPMPAEFTLLGITAEHFTARDMYLISGYLAFSFAEAMKVDPVIDRCRRLGPAYLKHLYPEFVSDSSATDVSIDIAALATKLTETMPVKPWIGSNAWVVAPSRTKSHSVLFANDTHIGYQQPSVWFEAHLEYPGFSLYGKYLSGMPFPLIGHNRKIAYGVTMFENDDIQLYRESSINSGASYIHGSDTIDFNFRKETIQIKGGTDTVITVRESLHGPVMNDVVHDIDSSEKAPVTMWWSFVKLPVTAFETVYGLQEAKNMAESRQAASLLNAPGINIAYGDIDGNIAVWACAKLPVYPSGVNTKMFADGSNANNDLVRYYPFNSNPHRENPSCGFVYTSNDDAGAVNGKSYPGYYPPTDRAQRVKELLGADSSISIEDMARIQNDVVSVSHASIAGILASEINLPNNFSIQQNAALELLKNWNGSHELNEKAPTVYYAFLWKTLQHMMQDEMGEADFLQIINSHQMKSAIYNLIKDSESPWWDDISTHNKKENRHDIVQVAFEDAVSMIVRTAGDSSNWQWGRRHLLEHVHPIGKKKPFDRLFNIGPLMMSGGIETVNNLSFPLSSEDGYRISFGPAMRTIIDLAKPEEGISTLPTGQSGHVLSDHYSDQAHLHVNGKYRPMLMNENSIKQFRKPLMLLPSAK